MEDILQTTDPVLLSFARSVLEGDGIECHILDQHISMVEGSIGVLTQRLAVWCDESKRARHLLSENGLGAHLSSAP